MTMWLLVVMLFIVAVVLLGWAESHNAKAERTLGCIIHKNTLEAIRGTGKCLYNRRRGSDG